MDNMTIERHKRMLVEEMTPLLEAHSDSYEFTTEIHRCVDGVNITVVALKDGHEVARRTMKVEMLNG